MKYIKLLYALSLCALTHMANAQVADTLEVQRNESGKINFARFEANDTMKMKDVQAFLKNILQTKADDGFSTYKRNNRQLSNYSQTLPTIL